MNSSLLSPLQDLLCVGSTQGNIYLISLGLASIAAHSQLHLGLITAANTNASAGRLSRGLGAEAHPSVLAGHSKAVTWLSFSRDNSLLASASLDGSLRVWNVWTRQCVRDCSPLLRSPLSSCMVPT